MQKNNYTPAKKKHFLLTVLTLLILVSCAVFTLYVYKHPDNAKALEDIRKADSGTGGPVSPPAVSNTGDKDGTDNENNTVNPGSSGSKSPASSELHGVWVSFFDYNEKGYTRESFTRQAETMFDTCKANNFSDVFVHVRMFADAMYNSKYFPWSRYSSGKIGKSPGFDPLSIMVAEAHKRGLKIHAWINPYRITKDTTSNSALAKSSYAYKWRNSKSPS